MARTPLFRTLERSFRLARLSLDSDRSASELLGELRERRVTRRSFLRTSTMAAAGIGLTGCHLPRLRSRETEVLIVGAGIAGLTTGYRLKRDGVPVRLLEAQDRVGGRMFSLRDYFADGQVAELGGELIDTGHTHIRELAAELGIPLDDLHEGETLPDVWHFGGRRIEEAEVVEAFRPVAARVARDLASLTEPWATYQEPNGAETLDRIPLSEWLATTDCEPWFQELLTVAYTTEYGLETDRQSALNLHFLIDPEPDPFRIFGESDERFHVRGGNDRITTALAGFLEPEIELGSRLERVRRRGDGSYECTFRRGGKSETATAPFLVLALPFTLLRDVDLDVELPEVKLRAIRELGYGTNAKLMAGFSERLWRIRYEANGAVFSDLPFQSTWETSREQAGSSGILTNFTGGDHGMELGQGTPAEQARLLVDGLETIFPGIAATRDGMKEARFHWPTHPWTRGSYASYLVGQWTTVAGAEGEPVGRLHFVGEHCSEEAQGFMEGGCETGERAAAAILLELRGRRPRTAA